MGIFFVLVSVVCWGLGDFLIQRGTRKFGDWIALFYITAFASLALLPFIYKDLGNIFTFNSGLTVLLIASVVIATAAYFDFEALRVGKISVIEPILAFEVAATAALAALVIKELPTPTQLSLIATTMCGIFLVSVKSFANFKGLKWEKGVAIAVMATIGMGAANFLFGLGARETTPLMVNWFTSLFMAIISLVFILLQNRGDELVQGFKAHGRLALSMSLIDNAAWIAFSYATLYIPIAIATSISESYIALAALLGISLNKERLKNHQIIGLALTATAATLLAAITKN